MHSESGRALYLPYHWELLLPPGARYTQREEPKKVALNANNSGSDDVQTVNQLPAPRPNTTGPQKSEYSQAPGQGAASRSR